MAEENFNSKKFKETAWQTVNSLSNQRTKEIIIQRFGLGDGIRQTLEAIGGKYGITRERVRQVEEAAFFDLKKPAFAAYFEPAFKIIDKFFASEGQVIREERLLSDLSGSVEPHPSRGALFFILTIGKPYQRFVESANFHPLWVNSEKILKSAENIITDLVSELNQKGKPVSFSDIIALLKERDVCLPKRAVFSYLDASKHIAQNSFGEYGLRHWSEISPRGVKDKAYIVFKREKKPMHFREVTELINQSNLGAGIAQPQTVHNELIKDNRFVLVGRGTYALSEWGYQPGTVREIIIETIKKEGPLSKDEILAKVLKNRLVKPNTVLINLQNHNYFIRNSEGRYIIK